MHMRHLLSPLAAVAVLSVGLTACVGGSDDATRIRATEARLNAHGRTDNGPARWWWEYGTSQADVNAGRGTRTPARGPASSPQEVKLGESVSGLRPLTTYYFRACAQDVNKPSASCGKVLSFTTTKANSPTLKEVRAGESLDPLVFNAAPGTRQDVKLTTSTTGAGVVKYRLEDTVGGAGSTGTSIVPSGTSCQNLADRRYDDAVECTPTDAEIDLNLGDQDDVARVTGPGRKHFIYIDCGPGKDTLTLDNSRGFDNYGWVNCETVNGP
jgi:hypothetical protein